MGARRRERDLTQGVSGSYSKPLIPSTFQSTQQQVDRTTTDDTVGWWNLQNSFTTTRIRYEVAQASGQERSSSGSVITVLSNMPLAYNVLPPALPDEPTPLELDWYARDIRSGTNPQLPSINSATSVGELKDIPGLLHSIRKNGFSLLKAVGAGYITKRFAIDPMLSDLGTLRKMAKTINDRTRQLEKLRDEKALKRKVSLGGYTTKLPDANVTLLSQGATLPAVRHGTIEVRRWGTAQWKLSSGTVLPSSTDELGKLARRLEYGITTASAVRSLWELFPWSWMIDWFTNFSSSLEGLDNSIGMSCGSMCFMETTTCKYTYSQRSTSSDDWDWVTLSGPHSQTRTRKLRRVAYTVLPISLPRMPFLTERHWSILSALAACQLSPQRGLIDRLLGEESGLKVPRLGRK